MRPAIGSGTRARHRGATSTAVAAPTRFTGVADSERRSFRALAQHQDRDWFQAHKREYDDGWLRPMQALLGEVRSRIDGAYPRQPLAAPFPPLPATLLVDRALVAWLVKHAKRVAPVVEWLAAVQE
jgi:uncharacterized protein (DUF2461 family)